MAVAKNRSCAGVGHHLTAFLGTVVLAINLFGWTLTSLPETSIPSPSEAATDIFESVPICEHAPGHYNDRYRDHGKGKLVCPACFPMGNASSGALLSTPPVALVSTQPIIVDLALPGDITLSASFLSHRYQARAPPLAA
ncbi:MAG TPA: hypothetical protein HPP80_09130 [Rhodospirillaceae bacterium]|nr:hypothetical protein [Rhodospirillaceae bacterium]